MSKNIRNKKKLKNDLPDEFIIDNAILEQNPSLINIQDVEQKILKIFKSNLSNTNINLDDSQKFEDYDSEGSHSIRVKNAATNGKLFETFKISKKAKNKLKSKPNANTMENFSHMNSLLMNNNLPSNFFDHYLSMANTNPNFQSPKNINNNLLSLIGMPMDSNPSISNELLGLLFQQYQQNSNTLIDNAQLNYGFNPMMDSQNLMGMPLNIILPQVANQTENLNANLPNFNLYNNNNNNKNDIENLLKMIYSNQQMGGNDNDQQANELKNQKMIPLQGLNNIINTNINNEAKTSFLNQKKASSFNYNDPHFLYDMENLGDKNDVNNAIPAVNNNFNNLEFQNFFGFDSKFLQNNPNFNFGINSMNPLLNEKMNKNEFPLASNENVLNDNFINVKRENLPEAEPQDNNKNNIDFNQLLAGDPNMFFNFHSNTNNPNLFFESILMNMNNMCNNNNTPNGHNQLNNNIFDLDSKNLLNNNNINNNHPNQ